ncbi:hypothetical protein J6590_087371 [Homalodisca vitripennis]|nr:hypothetical protein J6590_098086 [Homalodisca vitripennis]KAG8319639.1 hypothetical protein J6590_087371 [Homalodisca vitripennis]
MSKKSQIRSVECNHYPKGTEDQGQYQDLQRRLGPKYQALLGTGSTKIPETPREQELKQMS